MPILPFPPSPPVQAFPRNGIIGILDLEFTCWDGSLGRDWSLDWEWREVVQIGLLKVDAAADFAPIGGFEALVRPTRNPILSDYFTKLTGISQADVDRDGEAFATALRKLAAQLAGVDAVIFNGEDGNILRENCQINAIDFPLEDLPLLNFRNSLATILDVPTSRLTSSCLPELAGLSHHGRAHTALADCHAIAAALGAWRRAGTL